MNRFKVKGDKRFLVIARVGDSSLHPEWLQPAKERNFDLCLSYFDSQPGRFSEDCDFYHQTPGVKWPKLKEIVALFGDQIKHYDAIWLPDDDISTNVHDINRMFDLFMQYELELAQPALTKDSYYSHKITRLNSDFSLRYSQFVEPMVPIFSRNAFQTLLPTFEKSEAAYGLDFVWPKLLGYPHKKIGIIDEVTVKHTRPVGGGVLYQKISNNRWDDFHRVIKEYDVKVNWNPTHYDGVPRKKKVMIAVLAHHEDEKVLATQLENIRHFNPNAGIVVYNGSSNPDLTKNLNVPVCSYSRPLRLKHVALFMWDVMKWLKENEVKYEFFINLNSDMLFVKHGFEYFLDMSMKYSDCMGWDLQKILSDDDADTDSKKSMREERRKWKSILKDEGFLRYYSPGQVYRRKIVEQMLSSVSHSWAAEKMMGSEVQALEEYFFINLAKSQNARCREYPRDRILNLVSDNGLEVNLEKAQQAMHHPYYYFIHPVRGQELIELSSWLITGGVKQEAEQGATNIRKRRKMLRRRRRKLFGRKRMWRRKLLARGKKRIWSRKLLARGKKRIWSRKPLARGRRRLPGRKTFQPKMRKYKRAFPSKRGVIRRNANMRSNEVKRITVKRGKHTIRTVWNPMTKVARPARHKHSA